MSERELTPSRDQTRADQSAPVVEASANGHLLNYHVCPEIQLVVRCTLMGAAITLCECADRRVSSVNRQHAISNVVAKTDGSAVIVGYLWQNAGL